VPTAIGKRVTFVLAAVLVSAACARAGSITRSPGVSALVPELTTVLNGGSSTIREPLREIIRDSIRWRRIWDSLYVETSGSEPLIDFGRDMLRSPSVLVPECKIPW
jgi:hypothetical protein